MGVTMKKNSKEAISQKLKYLEYHITDTRKKITGIRERIYNQKKFILPNSKESHHLLCWLREDLKYQEQFLKIYKDERRKLVDYLNKNFNVHNYPELKNQAI